MKRRRGSKKGRQMIHNKKVNKYDIQYLKTVKRTGKWRGKKV